MDAQGLVNAIASLAVIALMAASIVVLGFAVDPTPEPPLAPPGDDRGAVRLPDDLPAPVRRHFETLSATELPRWETAAVWGRMRMRILGLWMPIRMHGWIEAGRQFVRRMDVCWAGQPVLTAVDSYLDGVGRLQVRSEVVSNAAVSQGQLLALWADAALTPSVYLTDPRLRWEPAGAHRARLKVEAGGEIETLTWDFHPQTGRLQTITALRHRHGEAGKVLWRVDYVHWRSLHGVLLPVKIMATWDDQRAPYAVMTIDGVSFNVEVAGRLVAPPEGQAVAV